MKKKGVQMRDLAAPEVQAMTDADWKKAVVDGVGKMKGIGTLSAPQLENMFAFMRTLKKK